MPERYYDVFVSYAHRDRPEWVEALAENLHQRGFEVFLDAWEIGAGDVLVHRLDEGILESRHGVLVLTRSYFESDFVRAEYAAILHRAIEGRQRVIPVLAEDVEVPPLLASRVWVDFRDADGPEYDRKVEELVRALEGKKQKDRPERTGEAVAPPGTRYRLEGAVRRTLRIGRGRVALLEGGEETASHEPKPLDHALEERIWELARARRRRFSVEEVNQKRGPEEAVVAEASLHEASLAAGAALTRTFLDGAAGEALREAVTLAETSGSSLELALEIDDELRSLPWEALRLPDPNGAPGEPLALHPRVHLYRSARSDGPTPTVNVPGPLRILVAIGSPETGGGELLDYEKELGRILDAVEPARKKGGAHVQVLHRGTVQAIREALDTERYHVLHLSCHAAPGVLILETDEGEEDRVTADRLWKWALPPDRGVPLVVLAGCATALDARRKRSEEGLREGQEAEEGEEVLPGLAAELLDHGVPTVLAMQAPVSDAYATDLAERLYRALATHAEPAPLDALARARQEVERDRRERDPQEPRYQLAEWATPGLYLRGTPQLLYDPAAPFEEIQEPPEARFAPGVVVRKVGEFVGRRREERLILKTLRGDRHAGALIRGIGGVGKSTLAAELLTRMVEDHLIVSTYGETAPETILDEVGKELLAVAHRANLPEDHPLRQLAPQIRRPDAEWKDRLDLLQRTVLTELPIVLLLDNFEDNLAEPGEEGIRSVRNQALADFLARWLETPGKSCLLVTSRHPFKLPNKTHRHLEDHHLGPLTFAETRKLFWRLPALEKLGPEDRLRAYRAVGGHPRALEYLDALLRGGEARFTDVEIHLEKSLERKGIPDPGAWIRDQAEGGLDQALAATVTAASADVLLEDLLKLLDPTPLARRLLLGASVYRVPVDGVALAWQVGEEVEPEPDPQWEGIQERIKEQEEEVRSRGETPTRENLGLSDAEWQTYDEAIERRRRPPIQVPDGIAEAHNLLERLGLLSRIPAGEATAYQVHRWTASALEKETNPGILQDSHRRAARFWRWRVEKMPQSRQADINQLLEARHHYYAAGEIEQAVEVTGEVCSQLGTWGAYGLVEQLCREVLGWVPEGSRDAAAFLHQLGIVSQNRGSYKKALRWYLKALAIFEELGDRAGMAGSYHQLGRVVHLQGSYKEAVDWYRKSLSIFEELEDRASIAIVYHQLGTVSQDQGSYADALVLYRKSLAIFEELESRAWMANSYGQLGNLSNSRGSYEEALEWYRKSLAIFEELGDRARMATTYHQLGVMSQRQQRYRDALELYRKSLAITEDLGDRAGMATSYHQLGRVAQERGSYEEALEWYHKALAINEEVGNQLGMASSLSQIGVLLTETGRAEEAVP